MDQKQIFELMDKFEKSHLVELKIESEGFKVTLKGPDTSTGAVSPYFALPPAHTAQPVTSEQSHSKESTTAKTNMETITSPIVGTFYRSPAPDAPPFVNEGDAIANGESLCIIEAMKIMNKLEADFACTIVRVLAEQGQMVEFGTPLFEVTRI